MEKKTKYFLTPPWPQQKSLNELKCLSVGPKYFQEVEVSREKGQAGFVPNKWTRERSEYYLLGIEYVTVDCLDGGQIKQAGPFRVRAVQDYFVLLEDSSGKILSHPKWLKIAEDEETYKSTATKVWSEYCLCEKAGTLRAGIVEDCLCKEIFHRYCAVCTRSGSNCHKRIEQFEREEAERITSQENTLLDSALSQNVCLCKEVFGDGTECYCGFAVRSTSKPEETGSGETKDGSTDERTADHGKQETSKRGRKKPRKGRAPPKETDISLTVGRIGDDIDQGVFDTLAAYFEEEATRDRYYNSSYPHMVLPGETTFPENEVKFTDFKEKVKLEVKEEHKGPDSNDCKSGCKIVHELVESETESMDTDGEFMLAKAGYDRKTNTFVRPAPPLEWGEYVPLVVY
ncbi:hypothetical protein R1sor_017997 [Riccia sorocarpa]|uniref:Uncharacterized protein n=1 Tax=Riccia sorocarpa TaxID=122646 RepID=A0ABD3I8E9_9MARC